MFRNTFFKYTAFIFAGICMGAMILPAATISAQAASVPTSASASTSISEVLSEESKAEAIEMIRDVENDVKSGVESEDESAGVQEPETRSTDVRAASEGCVLVTVEGTFEETEAEKILARLNEIRYEACAEGVMNPQDGEPLTLDDYVPLKWSADLENRALTRAAEASLLADHTRPNGQSCFTFLDSGIMATNETLAWGYGSIVESVNGWYTEKEAYLSQTSESSELGKEADASEVLLSGVTSHYVALINPDNQYVGAADFAIDGQRDACAAQFTAEDTTEAAAVLVSEEQVGNYGLYRQVVEIKAEDLALTHIKGRSTLGTGSMAEYETALVYVGDDGADQRVEPLDGYIYTSSDESVLAFDNTLSDSTVATAAAKEEGEVVITARIAGAPERLSVEKNVEVSDDIAENAGWNETERGLQYRKASGELITDKWLKIDGEWYRLDQDGYAQTGWYSEDGQWYYFDEDGAMVRGWVASDGKWYYMSYSEGKLQIGWVEFKGRWYYLSVQKGGAMQTGWLENEGATYYLDADGARVTGEVQIEGETYLFGDDGILQANP